MTEFIQGALMIVGYRVVTTVAGVLVIYFGFVLFRVGVYEKAGELRAAWGSRGLTLKQVAPGTFFALFGAGIVALSVWRGVDLDTIRARSTAVPVAMPMIESSETLGLPYLPLPDQIRDAIKSAADRKDTPASERKILLEWLTEYQKIQERIRYQANQPEESLDKKFKELGIEKKEGKV